MHAIGLWFHNTFFHAWHFLYNQVQLTNWFGNVVAGVVVWFVVTLLWKFFLKKWIKKALAEIHREEIERHHREIVKPEADARHREHLKALGITQLPPRDAKGHFVKRES